MGGRNSGRRYRYDTKTTTNECLFLDSRYMKRQGFLVPGIGGTLRWSSGGHETGSIGFTVYADRLDLNYRINGEPVKDSILLGKTPCNYGGHRYWFICPSCGKRQAVLYSPAGLFRCRKCHGLPYSSQMESNSDRASRKANKLRKRLGGEEGALNPIPSRPKGMHNKTYDRIVSQITEAEEAVFAELAVLLKLDKSLEDWL